MAETGYSQQDPVDSASDWRMRQFEIEQKLANVRTVVIVKVTGVASGGGGGAVAAPTTITVQPLVKWIDGQNNAFSHGQVNNVQVWRPCSGFGAIIIDPKVGDIGLLAVCDRDITSLVANSGSESQPGSRRKFDMADGVYLGSLFGAAPTQYITFTNNGVEIADKNNNTIVMSNSGIAMTSQHDITINGLKVNTSGQIDGALPVNGALQLAGSIENLAGSEYTQNIATTGTIAGSNVIANPGASQVTLTGHIHPSNGAPPTPGH